MYKVLKIVSFRLQREIYQTNTLILKDFNS
jgi:hypothetical protein